MWSSVGPNDVRNLFTNWNSFWPMNDFSWHQISVIRSSRSGCQWFRHRGSFTAGGWFRSPKTGFLRFKETEQTVEELLNHQEKVFCPCGVSATFWGACHQQNWPSHNPLVIVKSNSKREASVCSVEIWLCSGTFSILYIFLAERASPRMQCQDCAKCLYIRGKFPISTRSERNCKGNSTSVKFSYL